MRIDELKDGMFIVERSGKELIVIGNNTYRLKEDMRYSEYDVMFKNSYNEEMKDICDVDEFDIMKVLYMGEVIWERKEYVTFDEARKSGKRFRYKEWNGYRELSEVFGMLYTQYPVETSNEMLDSKEWEIEQ